MNQFNSGDYLSRMGTESDNFCDPRFKDSAAAFRTGVRVLRRKSFSAELELGCALYAIVFL